MDTLATIGILAGIGIAGYLGYEYISKNLSSTSTTTTPATPSYVPIGQATPYETTGHLEDPLINELLNAINNLKSQVSSQTSPTTTPTYNYYYTGGGTSGVSSGGGYPSLISPLSGGGGQPVPNLGGTCAGGSCPAPPLPAPKPSIQQNVDNTGITTTITNLPQQIVTPVNPPPPPPPPSVLQTAEQVVSNLIQTGANINTQQASEIQKYNPYYQPGTPTTASSKIGSAITGAVVTALGGPQSKLAQTYLNVTRPVVTTGEALMHPQLQAFNQAISSAENVAKQAEQTISQTAQQTIPQAQKVAQNVVNTVGNVASSIAKSIFSVHI